MSDIDLDKYRRHVAHFGLSKEKENELLAAIWEIARSFVDRAFGHDPVQQAFKVEGKLDAKDASTIPPVIEWANSETLTTQENLTNSFRDKSGGDRRKR